MARREARRAKGRSLLVLAMIMLPAAARVIPYRTGTLTMRTATGTGTLSARILDYADPLARGIYTQLSGRAPANPDEVALTRSAATRLGVDLNGSVRLNDGSRTFRVASIVEDPKEISATTIILPPQQLRLSEDRAD